MSDIHKNARKILELGYREELGRCEWKIGKTTLVCCEASPKHDWYIDDYLFEYDREVLKLIFCGLLYKE